MGKLEAENKKRVRRRDLQYAILHTVQTVGFLGAAILAPNVLTALSRLGFLPKSRQKEYISSSASKLVRRGLLVFRGGHYSLSQEGKKILRQWELEDNGFKKSKKWDKKWRVIIFDIPEKKKTVRVKISRLFRQVGMYRLQDSVWIYPYDCEDIIGLLKTDLGIGKELLYMIVDELENDRYLREEFRLIS